MEDEPELEPREDPEEEPSHPGARLAELLDDDERGELRRGTDTEMDR